MIRRSERSESQERREVERMRERQREELSSRNSSLLSSWDYVTSTGRRNEATDAKGKTCSSKDTCVLPRYPPPPPPFYSPL